MMKKIVLSMVGLGLALALIAGVVYNTHSGQDALFARAVTMIISQAPEPVESLRVVVCGSASPLGNDPARAQACIAVLTPEHFFLFDVGARSPLRIAQARLPLARLNGVFLTHFHSDHIAALPDVSLTSWVQGRKSPLAVHGPAGVQQVVNGFNLAYQLDRGYRTAHHGSELLPAVAAPMQAVEFTPGEIAWQDELLTISTFLVEHPPIEPAVGYRIDYRGRSVVISGDTNAADSLFTAARNADLLFHDALSLTLLEPMIAGAEAADASVASQVMTDVIDYHADAASLPQRAAAAGIKQLVFYHMVPVPANALAEKMFLRNLPASIILAKDLHTFDLPAGTTNLHIHEP